MCSILLEKTSIHILQDSIQYQGNEYKCCNTLSETHIMDELLPNSNYITFVFENQLIIYFKKTNEFYLIENDTKITQNNTDDTIGLTLDLILMNINDNQPIIAKVDTGADSTTLRVSSVEIRTNPLNEDTEQVRFVFNEKTYIKNVSGYHTIKTSEGNIEHRPYITLDIKFGDSLINNIDINLSTINGDQYQILAGLNLLQELDYKIDVNEVLTTTHIRNILESIESINNAEDTVTHAEELN